MALEILFYDSGIGGLPYLGAAQTVSADLRFHYIADNINFPLGSKSEMECQELIVESIARFTELRRINMLVLACNTATITALARLRSQYKFPIIGTVPAVKTAAQQSKKKSLVLLASDQTSNASYLDRLISKFAPQCQVRRIAAGSLINFIENDLYKKSTKQVDAFLAKYISGIIDSGADQLVLGCTHFLLIKDYFKRLLPKGIRVVDSVQGVLSQIRRKVEDLSISGSLSSSSPGQSTLYPSSYFVEDMLPIEPAPSSTEHEKFKFWAANFTLELAQTNRCRARGRV